MTASGSFLTRSSPTSSTRRAAARCPRRWWRRSWCSSASRASPIARRSSASPSTPVGAMRRAWADTTAAVGRASPTRFSSTCAPRLSRSTRPNRIFEVGLEAARQAGLIGRRRVLDSTPLDDAVATHRHRHAHPLGDPGTSEGRRRPHSKLTCEPRFVRATITPAPRPSPRLTGTTRSPRAADRQPSQRRLEMSRLARRPSARPRCPRGRQAARHGRRPGS